MEHYSSFRGGLGGGVELAELVVERVVERVATVVLTLVCRNSIEASIDRPCGCSIAYTCLDSMGDTGAGASPADAGRTGAGHLPG